MRIVVSSINFPLTMSKYFERALERRDDVELITLGPFTGSWIPWQGGMNVLPKYANPPTCPLPQSLMSRNIPFAIAKAQFGEQLQDIDLWIQVDASWHFTDRPEARIVAHVQTDPHCLKDSYKLPKSYSDYNFCMQGSYIEYGEKYLPYAADKVCHAPMEGLEKDFDVCMVGLHYDHRNQLVRMLRGLGLNVYYDIGSIFEEFTELYSRSKVAISWSSLLDLPARVFENMYMAIPLVTNRVPDLSTHFVEDEHYLGFSNPTEAVAKVAWALNNLEDANEMAWRAHRKVKALHLWENRIEQILDNCGLI
jgi:glycosyltransferase involved in cell wall biosynthesis